jgi:hypothetical protein
MHIRNIVPYAFMALVVLGCSSAAAEDLQTLYVPLVRATIGSTLEPDGHSVDIESWESTMSVFNPTDSPADIVNVAVYGRGAGLAQPSRPPIPPHQGAGISASVTPYPERGVGFLEVRTSPGVVFSADVERVTQRCEVGAPNCISFLLGAVNIPFYRALFPAGSVAISGAVELGQFGLSQSGFPPGTERRRRMNVTLFNAGNVPATFVVRTLPHNFGAEPLVEQTVVVASKDVFQVNGFPVPTESSNQLTSVHGSAIWVTISADQPFLSYVSTIFNAVEPGDLPFQVYPSFLQN